MPQASQRCNVEMAKPCRCAKFLRLSPFRLNLFNDSGPLRCGSAMYPSEF